MLVNGGKVFRTFCAVEDAVDAVCRMISSPDKSSGHAFNVGNPENNIQISHLAQLMIELYSKMTGEPKGTTRIVSGEVCAFSLSLTRPFFPYVTLPFFLYLTF